MVHNGIEYGDMQLIGEVYQMMKDILKMSNEEIATVLNISLIISLFHNFVFFIDIRWME